MVCIKKNVISLFLLLSISIVFSQKTTYDVYDALDKEKEMGFNVKEEHKLLLDSIFVKASEEIIFPENVSDSTALDVCIKLSHILKNDFGFSYTLVQAISLVLEDRVLDCNYYTLIFYTFLNKYKGYKVYPVVVPGHMFIRWYFDDTSYINYETTTFELLSDSAYKEEFKISEQATTSCLYMCPLSDTQFMALHWAELAYDLFFDNTPKAIELNKEALKLFPESYHILNNLSICYLVNEDYEMSEKYFEKAFMLDSLNYTIYQNRGNIYMWLEKYNDALLWFNKAVKLNPDDPSLYMDRCNVYIQLKDVDMALNDFVSANVKIEKKSLLSFLVNYEYLSYLDSKILKLINGDFE